LLITLVNLHGFYPIACKYDVFSIFPKFQAYVERLFDRKIKSIQTDGGGEFQKLRHLFTSHGIHHRITCPHTHQQNGSVERKHQHIVEMGLTLIKTSSGIYSNHFYLIDREGEIMRSPNYAESVLLFLCTATTICFAFNLHDSEVMRCIEEERQALLKFRQGLLYSTELSWGTHEEDCCKWEGIKCSNRTGHVVNCNTPSPLRLGLSLFFFSNKIFAKIHKVYQST
jgi:hypothetical protein